MSTASAYSQLTAKVYSGSRVDSTTAITNASSAVAALSQPSYSPVYLADRRVASSSGGGCGTVSYVRKQDSDQDGSGLSLGLSLAAMLAMFALAFRMLQPEGREKRKHERFKIDSEVRISLGDQVMVGNISTISAGGVCINTSALLKDGGLIKMQIASPDGKETVEVEGRVVWSEERKAYGVAFQNTTETVADRIAHWTQSLVKAS